MALSKFSCQSSQLTWKASAMTMWNLLVVLKGQICYIYIMTSSEDQHRCLSSWLRAQRQLLLVLDWVCQCCSSHVCSALCSFRILRAGRSQCGTSDIQALNWEIFERPWQIPSACAMTIGKNCPLWWQKVAERGNSDCMGHQSSLTCLGHKKRDHCNGRLPYRVGPI